MKACWDFIDKESDKMNEMKTVTIKVAQNGGEYYGYVKIESEHGVVQKLDHYTVSIDGRKVTFDEYIEVISVK